MRKVTFSILAVILSVLTLSTVTYAWISLATSNTVENISLSFSGDRDLEISLDGINYYSELPGELIEDVIGRNRLIDVSSVDGINFSTFHDKGKEAVKNQDYLQIDFYFRSSNVSLKNVYLVNHNPLATYQASNNRGTFIISEGRLWTSNLDFHYGPNTYGILENIKAGESNKFYLSEAMRISFNEQQFDNLDLRDSSDLNKKIFDLSKDPTRAYGLTYGAYDYFKVVNGPMPLTNLKQNVITELSNVENGYASSDISHILTLEYRETINGLRYSYGKVTMSIWIEGWDPDTFDAVFRDRVKIGLQFRAGLPAL